MIVHIYIWHEVPVSYLLITGGNIGLPVYSLVLLTYIICVYADKHIIVQSKISTEEWLILRSAG